MKQNTYSILAAVMILAGAMAQAPRASAVGIPPETATQIVGALSPLALSLGNTSEAVARDQARIATLQSNLGTLADTLRGLQSVGFSTDVDRRTAASALTATSNVVSRIAQESVEVRERTTQRYILIAEVVAKVGDLVSLVARLIS